MRSLGIVFLLFGVVFFVLSTWEDFMVSQRSSPALTNSTETLMSLKISELQQTIAAGSTRIFAGLWLVAGAILYVASERKTPAKPVAPEDSKEDRKTL
jgi:hypothetical protein